SSLHFVRSIMNVGRRNPVAARALGCLFGAAQGLANEGIGQQETCLANETDRQADDLVALLVRLDLDANLLSLQPCERATEPLAPGEQVFELDPGLIAGPIRKIGGSHQGPVDAGG